MSLDATPLQAALSIPVALHLFAARPEANAPFPVLLALHGYAMDAPSMLALARRMAPPGFLLVAPEGPHSTLIPGNEASPERRSGFHWGVSPRAEDNRAAHRAAVAAAIVWSVQQGGDPRRVSLLGFSQPCSFNYRLALDPPHGEPIRSLVALCGGVPGEWSADSSVPSETSSAAALHISTREDPFYPLERVTTFPTILSSRFASVQHRLHDGAHRVPSAAFDEIRSFLAKYG